MRFLKYNHNVDCDSPLYTDFITFAVLMVGLWPVGYLVFVLWLLRQHPLVKHHAPMQI